MDCRSSEKGGDLKVVRIIPGGGKTDSYAYIYLHNNMKKDEGRWVYLRINQSLWGEKENYFQVHQHYSFKINFNNVYITSGISLELIELIIISSI